MVRILRVLFVAAVLVAVFAGASPAQEAETWPLHPDVDSQTHNFIRGPGGYLSITKIVFLWLLFLLWVKIVDWVNRDTQITRMPYVIWTPVVFFPFVVGFFLLALQIPSFAIGYFLLMLCVGVPLGVYVWQRNQRVERHEQVLTVDHLRHLLSRQAKTVGVKIEAEKKAAHEKGPPVELFARGGQTDRDNNANLLTARQSPGFLAAKTLVDDALTRRADKVMLDFTRDAVAIRYQIDGIWHDLQPGTREDGDVLLAVLKKLSALDPAERRARQEGEFGAAFQGTTYTGSLISQGTKMGERVILQLASETTKVPTLSELGMRDKMQERLKEILSREAGFVLISSMPSGGLTTTFNAALKATDRFMRDFVAIEDEANREVEIENVNVTTYNAGGGETPDAVLPKLIRTEPNVVVLRDLPNAETVKILCNEVNNERLVIAGIRAKEAVEALLRVLLLKVPAEEFAPTVVAVLNQRLIRTLCDACKEAYAPPADLLKKLGIPPNRVDRLYRPPTPPQTDEEKQEHKVCPECGDIGYKGRTAIFELLVVDKSIRETLVAQPKGCLEWLRKAARKAGQRSLQEEGVVMVVRGLTSLAELSRVLKQ